MAPPSVVPAGFAHSLTLAIVASSDAPLVLLDGLLNIIAASTSFCDAFELDCDAIRGEPLAAVGGGEWAKPQFTALLRATASGLAAIAGYEMELARPGKPLRTLQLNAHLLKHDAEDQVLVMLAVTDITDARAAKRRNDDLVHEKAVLVREMQHRVANSLQIIASVLMQSARRVQSEEARGHLHAAHNRVMSVASVQRQLAGSGTEDVRLRPYFEQLCLSLGASMIHDHDQIKLVVTCDDAVVPSATSISLGLVVTELVINALKHAFPQERPGTVTVGYSADGGDWHLSVVDDGVGMKSGQPVGKAGLGTSIVEALTRQLGAVVTVCDAAPGTSVVLIHKAVAANNDNPAQAEAEVL